MTKVYIHGKLGKFFGEYHEVNVSKKLDIVNAIDANRKGFKKTILSCFKKNIHFDIIDPVASEQTFASIDQFLNQPAPKEVHILPSIGGSGVVLGFISAVGAAVGAVGSAVGGIIASVGGFLGSGTLLANMALGILMQGIAFLLTPKPKGPESQKVESKIQQASYLFSSLENQAVQGFAIPLLYGELRVGSNVITVNVVSEDIEKQ